MAYVVVVHLDPHHKSILPELLQKETPLKVQLAEGGLKVEPNRVYVAPPNKDLAIMGGVLRLLEPEASRGVRLPIDFFFQSLAEDQGEMAICVILSGTGSDGTRGLKAIKERGGLVLVQEEGSAKYSGMPHMAIATGLADFVIPPEKMPETLARYRVHAAQLNGGVDKGGPPPQQVEEALGNIFVLLRRQTGHDFSFYKRNTIRRRIERRMAVHQLDEVGNYISYLRNNPAEVELLFKEILIGVTGFFRDPESFASLKEKIGARMAAGFPGSTTFRVWVPGCSTGEEAFSLAILLKECQAECAPETDIQVFATDIDGGAIDQARVGVFPQSIAADVSPERLKRFFNQQDSAYAIKKEIRDFIVFSVQDILKDPPFSKLDLLCCRNLLIYLNAEAQRKVLRLFHYTLLPGGILCLGSSESVGRQAELFSIMDKKWRIYRRKEMPPLTKQVIDFPTGPDRGTRVAQEAAEPIRLEEDLASVTARLLLARYSPACVVIDREGNISYIQGRTGKYLEPAPGRVNLHLVAMARQGLRVELSAAIRQAAASRQRVFRPGLKVKTNGREQMINLTVEPLGEPDSDKGLMMVVFQDVEGPVPGRDKGKPAGAAGDQGQRIEELGKELQIVRETHQTTVEELESSNEELKSTNEEMQSTNEELQSTNEELESSKEELQSLNEELTTVNTELQSKLEQLSRIQDDMTNLLNSTEIATIFIDSDLRVKSFTPAATRIVNLIQADMGRPIEHIVVNLTYEHLVEDVKAVIDSLASKTKEVRTKDNVWYLMRVMPYRTIDNVIDGAVVTFTSIDEQKKAQARLEEVNRELERARDYAESVVNTIREPLLVLNGELEVVSANESFYRKFQVAAEETLGRFIYDLGEKEWGIPELRELLEKIVSGGGPFEDLVVEHEFPRVGLKKIILNARRFSGDKGETQRILLALEEVGTPVGGGVKASRQDGEPSD